MGCRQIEAPGGEAKHCGKTLGRTKTAGLPLDGGEDAVAAFEEDVGYTVHRARHDASKVPFDHLRRFHHRREQHGRGFTCAPGHPACSFRRSSLGSLIS